MRLSLKAPWHWPALAPSVVNMGPQFPNIVDTGGLIATPAALNSDMHATALASAKGAVGITPKVACHAPLVAAQLAREAFGNSATTTCNLRGDWAVEAVVFTNVLSYLRADGSASSTPHIHK